MLDDASKGVQYARGDHTGKFIFRLLRFAALFKHASFIAEREWRVVSPYAGMDQHPFVGFAGRPIDAGTICSLLPRARKRDTRQHSRECGRPMRRTKTSAASGAGGVYEIRPGN